MSAAKLFTAGALACALLLACSDRESDDGGGGRDTGLRDTGGGTDTGGGNDTGGGTDTGGGGGGEVTIFELQDESSDNHPAVDGTVTTSGVITAIDTEQHGTNPANIGSIWLQDPAGGPFSGVQVFNPNNADIDTSGLEIGQTLQVTGTYEEFFDQTEITNVTAFEVLDEGVTLVAPVIVAEADVADGGDLAEQYEGVLITVTDVTVSNANPDGPDDDFGAALLSGGLYLDDDLLEWDPRPEADQSFASITGILTYTFDHFRIVPRSMSDVVPSP